MADGKWAPHRDHNGTDHEWSLQDSDRAFLLFNFHPAVSLVDRRRIAWKLAAAPDLYEAARALVAFLRGSNTLSTRGAEIEISRLCGNAEAALSRARGETA